MQKSETDAVDYFGFEMFRQRVEREDGGEGEQESKTDGNRKEKRK